MGDCRYLTAALKQEFFNVLNATSQKYLERFDRRGSGRSKGNVADQGVIINPEVDDSKAGTPWVSSSESGVQTETTLDADPGVFKYVQPGQLGVKVSLDKGNKYILSLKGARFHRIASIDPFWDDVRSSYSIWKWNRGRKLVTSICTAWCCALN